MVTDYLEPVTFREATINDTYKRLLEALNSPSFVYPVTTIPQDEQIDTTTSGSVTAFYLLPVEQTFPYHYDLEMTQLKRAVLLEDADAFTQSATDMDWKIRSEDDYLKAIELALQVGAHLIARKLSQEGANRFPENERLMKHARVLAPVKLICSNAPADPGVAKNNLWLKEHREEYQGRWVALRDGNLLAFGNSIQDVKNKVGPLKNSRILVTKVY